MLDQGASKKVAERRAQPDGSRQRALDKIEAARTSGAIGNHQDRYNTKDCIRNAVQQLNRDQLRGVVREGVQQSPDREYAEAQQEERLSSMRIRVSSDKWGRAHDDDLRDHNAGRHERCGGRRRSLREHLAELGQHGGIGKMKKEGAHHE